MFVLALASALLGLLDDAFDVVADWVTRKVKARRAEEEQSA